MAADSRSSSPRNPRTAVSFRFFASAAVLGLLLAGSSGPVFAASPASGTVTPSGTAATWTGGPFPANNQLNQLGGTPAPPVCVGNTAPCDDYALTVSIPATDPTQYIVTVRIQWTRTDADFDLFVLDSSGLVVGDSATAADPETLTFAAVPRSTTSYTVRVIPFNVQTGAGGDVYTGTVTLTPAGSAPASPPPVPNPAAAPGTPRYQSYTPPKGTGLGLSAGEPSVGVNWRTGKVFFQSDLQTLRVTFFDQACSAFSKALWENRSPATSQEDSDPILFTDHQTGRTIAGMLLLLTGRNESSVTDDDGEHWTASSGSSITSGVDHETVGGGPFAPPLTRDPNGSLYPNAVYYCSQDIATALCAVSTDGGLTYGPAVPIYNLTQCGGLHGHIKVAPDGTAYVPNDSCGGKSAAIFSTDNGATWTVSPIPDSSAGESDPSIGIGNAGTIYFGYQANGGHPNVAAGRRIGNAIQWGPSHDVGGYFHIENTAFSTVVAGDDDRAAFGFLGAEVPGDFQDANYRGVWHLYVAHTYDAGQTWTTVDATPDDPVQRGCIWMQGGAVTCRNLLDFNDATVDAQGRVLIGYADGCVAPCNGAPPAAYGNSFSALGTIARQTGGRRLFHQFDPVEPVLPGAATVSATRAASGIDVTWVEPDSGGSPISSYRVWRRPQGGSRVLAGTAGASVRSFHDGAPPAGTVFYSVSAVNSLGETPACGLDQSETAADPYLGSPCQLPGVLVASDASGDQAGAPLNADLDILSVSVAEPFSSSSPNNEDLEFTLKVNAGVATTLPNRQWRVIWAYPNGPGVPNIPFSGLYYVGMNSDASGAVTFEYGTVEVQVIGLVLGNPVGHKIGATTGVHLADGTIRIVIPKNAVGNPAPRDILGQIYARTFAGSADTTMRSTTGIDTSPAGSYAVAGNASCAPVVTTVCLEEDSQQISYSNGWHQLSDPNASGGKFRLHEGSSSSGGLSLGFDVPAGTTGAVIYKYATSPNGGSAQALVDGASKGTISYAGSSGSLRHPQFGASVRYGSLAPGRHTLQLSSLSGAVYVDQICLETATSNDQPTAGPAKTDEYTDALAAAGQAIHTISATTGTLALSVVAQASAAVPIQLVLIDPTGATVATASGSNGIASLEAPVSANGFYIAKVVNMSAGPVSIWSAATAWAAR